MSVMPRAQWEPWLLYREPIETKTVADNLRKWKTGGLRRISPDQPFGDVIRSHPTGKIERRIAPHPSLKPQSFLRAVVRAMLPSAKAPCLTRSPEPDRPWRPPTRSGTSGSGSRSTRPISGSR